MPTINPQTAKSIIISCATSLLGFDTAAETPLVAGVPKLQLHQRFANLYLIPLPPHHHHRITTEQSHLIADQVHSLYASYNV
jgi:hypothetical protein